MENKKLEKPNILRIAESLVYGDREKSYGHPREDFTRIASMWSVLLKTTVTPEQVIMCMIALKLSRESNSHKEDNIVDIAGYAACLEKLLKNQ